MTKPHEQEWTLDAFGDVCRSAESLAAHTNATPEEMRLMAAAPDMARELTETRAALLELHDVVMKHAVSANSSIAPKLRKAQELVWNPSPALRKAGMVP